MVESWQVLCASQLSPGDNEPERVDHTRQTTQESQDDVDPEMQRRSNLHEGCNGGQKNCQENFDNVQDIIPVKINDREQYNRLATYVNNCLTHLS